MWEFLNSSEQFLQVMSLYNIASPIISIFMPCVMLIIPFFIIKIKGISLSIDEYIKILKLKLYIDEFMNRLGGSNYEIFKLEYDSRILDKGFKKKKYQILRMKSLN